ncbi:MAG: hypothetical protein Q8O00_02580 [Holophaga sp.]|nr:hypothetical protein [Holophaga sp.]
MSQDLVLSLQRQNRLLKQCMGLGGLALTAMLLVAAKSPTEKTRFAEIDVERINVINPNGKVEMVLANRTRLPKAIVDGKEDGNDRNMPGLIFYNEIGDECGGLIFSGKLDAKGKPASGMHLSMDRFGGDQQLALGHYEDGGHMETGLNVYDRGLSKDYAPLYEAFDKEPEGPAKEALKKQWEAAGGAQTRRLFVGKTRGKSSAIILADAKGKPRIMMLVSPDGQPVLNFLDDQGKVTQSLPQVSPKKP